MIPVEEQVPLVSDLQRGDKKTFDAFYYRYYQSVFRNITKLIHRHDIAEDILQEVFLALWEHRSQLDPERPVDGWLFVVSYNKSINWLKKNSQEKNFLAAPVIQACYDSEETKLQEQSFQNQVAVINDAVNQLPPRKKQAFKLCKLEGRSYEEAGELLGISSDTVKEYVKNSSQIIRRYIAAQPTSHAVLVMYALILLPV